MSLGVSQFPLRLVLTIGIVASITHIYFAKRRKNLMRPARNIEYMFHAGNSTKTASTTPRNVPRNSCHTPPLTLPPLPPSRFSSPARLQPARPWRNASRYIARDCRLQVEGDHRGTSFEAVL